MTTKQILIIVTDTFSAQKDAPHVVVGFDKCFAWLQKQKHISSLCYFLDICKPRRTPQSQQLFMDYTCSKRHLYHNASNITHHQKLHTSVKFQPGQTSPNPKLWYKYRYVYYHI